jgi:hypothetical protein
VLHSGHDLLGQLLPDEGLPVVVPVLGQSSIASRRPSTEEKVPIFAQRSVRWENQPSTSFSHDELVGVMCRYQRARSWRASLLRASTLRVKKADSPLRLLNHCQRSCSHPHRTNRAASTEAEIHGAGLLPAGDVSRPAEAEIIAR